MHLCECGVGDVGELRGVSDHLEVSALLFGGECELIPDVHPVAVLLVDLLSADFDLYVIDDVLTDIVQPAGVDAAAVEGNHGLVDLWQGDLEVGSVCQISVSADGAGHATTEVCLPGEGLFDAFHGKVRVALELGLPVGDFGGSGEVTVLCSICD